MERRSWGLLARVELRRRQDGHAARRTTAQWAELGFNIHVVSDEPQEEVLPCVTFHTVGTWSHGKYGLTWEVIRVLLALSEDFEIFAYAEDDILVPQAAFDAWLESRRVWQGETYNPGFYRVESSDGSSLTDHPRWVHDVVATSLGGGFARMSQP